MAAKKEPQDQTLYHPGGTKVQVTKSRAAALKKRGYTTSKPKPADDSSGS